MIYERAFSELSTDELYELLRLRSQVFIVEQACIYADIDGRDTERGTRHLFMKHEPEAGPTDSIAAYLRVLDNGQSSAIGRVLTARNRRGQGLATHLLRHALKISKGPWTLNAQTHLRGWYEQFGFVRAGADFDEDGILHLPMHQIDAFSAIS